MPYKDMEQSPNLYWRGGAMIILVLVILYVALYGGGCGCSVRNRDTQDTLEKQNTQDMEHLFLSNINMTAFPSSFGFTPLTGELMVPNVAGVVLQAGTNYVRVSGTASTTSNNGGAGTTANQIQLYNNGTLTAAFDVGGLYVNGLNVSGASLLGGTLGVTGVTTLSGNASVGGTFGVTGDSTFNKLTANTNISTPFVTVTGGSTSGGIVLTGDGDPTAQCQLSIIGNYKFGISFNSLTTTMIPGQGITKFSVDKNGTVSCGSVACGGLTCSGTPNSSLLFQNTATSMYWYTGIRGDTNDVYAIYNNGVRFQIDQSGTVSIPGAINSSGALYTSGGSLNICDGSSSLRLINYGGNNYIQSGNNGFSGNSDLFITGYGTTNQMNNLYLKANTVQVQGTLNMNSNSISSCSSLSCSSLSCSSLLLGDTSLAKTLWGVTIPLYVGHPAFYSSFPGGGNGFYSNGGISQPPSQSLPFSAYFSDWICVGGAVLVTSDKRTKENVSILGPETCLDVIKQIPSVTFNFIGKSTVTAGFIAQDVKKVYPNAVHEMSEFIPDIYSLHDYITKSSHTITLSSPLSIANGSYVRIIDNRGKEIECIYQDRILHSESSLDECDFPDKVFIYGTLVHDKLSLDKDQLLSLAVGSINELTKRNDELKKKVDSLESKLDAIMSKLGM